MKQIDIVITERGKTYRKGNLFIDGRLILHTLEPRDGELEDYNSNEVIQLEKQKGLVAIPYGTYDVKMVYSKRFGRVLPQLMNVKGFEAIEIHNGNSSIDTKGCILVGINDRVNEDWIGFSLTACKILNTYLSNGINEPIKLTIKPY